MSDLVRIGTLWQRTDGVIVEVVAEREWRGTREVNLSPVDVPHGKRARRSWKYDRAVMSEMTPVNGSEPEE